MKLPTLKKISDKQGAAVPKGLEFSPLAMALFAQGESARAWLEKLDSAALHEDAIRLLAGVLPRRDCVHWALACSQEALAKTASPTQRAALDATARWTKDPSDANRRAAGAASEAALLDNTAGCTALAAFMAEGSIAPAGLTPVPPAEHLCALSSCVAIQLAAQMDGALAAAKHLQRFFELGVKLAEEPTPWETAATVRAPAPTKKR